LQGVNPLIGQESRTALTPQTINLPMHIAVPARQEWFIPYYNRSSVAVIVYDATGAVYIPAGSTVSARFNSDATIYDVYYDATSPVTVTQSGYSFTFRD